MGSAEGREKGPKRPEVATGRLAASAALGGHGAPVGLPRRGLFGDLSQWLARKERAMSALPVSKAAAW